MKPNQFIIEEISLFNFDKTVEKLVAEAERREWKVQFVHDLQHSLAKSGKSVKPVKVIEICKPEYSGQMLELSDERIICYDALQDICLRKGRWKNIHSTYQYRKYD